MNGYSLDKIEEMISEKEIAQRVQELATDIDRDYSDLGELVLICVLKGAVVFYSDLARKIKTPFAMEFLKASSYGNEKKSSGSVGLDLNHLGDLEGKNILLVEDIVDTGLTIKTLMEKLAEQKPASIKLVALLRKACNDQFQTKVNYLAFDIEDKFVVGYGLDYAGRYRGLPYIGVFPG